MHHRLKNDTKMQRKVCSAPFLGSKWCQATRTGTFYGFCAFFWVPNDVRPQELGPFLGSAPFSGFQIAILHPKDICQLCRNFYDDMYLLANLNVGTIHTNICQYLGKKSYIFQLPWPWRFQKSTFHARVCSSFCVVGTIPTYGASGHKNWDLWGFRFPAKILGSAVDHGRRG